MKLPLVALLALMILLVRTCAQANIDDDTLNRAFEECFIYSECRESGHHSIEFSGGYTVVNCDLTKLSAIIHPDGEIECVTMKCGEPEVYDLESSTGDYGLTINSAALTPNGDGINDKLEARYSVSVGSVALETRTGSQPDIRLAIVSPMSGKEITLEPAIAASRSEAGGLVGVTINDYLAEWRPALVDAGFYRLKMSVDGIIVRELEFIVTGSNCDRCGEGAINLCDMQECGSLGSCEYTDIPWGFDKCLFKDQKRLREEVYNKEETEALKKVTNVAGPSLRERTGLAKVMLTNEKTLLDETIKRLKENANYNVLSWGLGLIKEAGGVKIATDEYVYTKVGAAWLLSLLQKYNVAELAGKCSIDQITKDFEARSGELMKKCDDLGLVYPFRINGASYKEYLPIVDGLGVRAKIEIVKQLNDIYEGTCVEVAYNDNGVGMWVGPSTVHDMLMKDIAGYIVLKKEENGVWSSKDEASLAFDYAREMSDDGDYVRALDAYMKMKVWYGDYDEVKELATRRYWTTYASIAPYLKYEPGGLFRCIDGLTDVRFLPLFFLGGGVAKGVQAVIVGSGSASLLTQGYDLIVNGKWEDLSTEEKWDKGVELACTGVIVAAAGKSLLEGIKQSSASKALEELSEIGKTSETPLECESAVVSNTVDIAERMLLPETAVQTLTILRNNELLYLIKTNTGRLIIISLTRSDGAKYLALADGAKVAANDALTCNAGAFREKVQLADKSNGVPIVDRVESMAREKNVPEDQVKELVTETERMVEETESRLNVVPSVIKKGLEVDILPTDKKITPDIKMRPTDTSIDETPIPIEKSPEELQVYTVDHHLVETTAKRGEATIETDHITQADIVLYDRYKGITYYVNTKPVLKKLINEASLEFEEKPPWKIPQEFIDWLCEPGTNKPGLDIGYKDIRNILGKTWQILKESADEYKRGTTTLNKIKGTVPEAFTWYSLTKSEQFRNFADQIYVNVVSKKVVRVKVSKTTSKNVLVADKEVDILACDEKNGYMISIKNIDNPWELPPDNVGITVFVNEESARFDSIEKWINADTTEYYGYVGKPLHRIIVFYGEAKPSKTLIGKFNDAGVAVAYRD